MAEIINLRRAKKAKARQSAEKEAAANRAASGQPKREKNRVKILREADAKKIESHKLDDED